MITVSDEQAREAMFDCSGLGFCTACGAEHYNCEPDAQHYRCDECGKHSVNGFENLLVQGLVEIEDE